MKWPHFLVAAATAVLAACASNPTPYQPFVPYGGRGIHGGYSEQRLAAGHYLVKFHGNSMTSRDRVEGYLLYRVAELTLQNGFDWFLVVDRGTDDTVRTIIEPDPFYRPWYGPQYGYWRPEWTFYSSGVGWRGWSSASGSVFQPDRYQARRVEAFEARAEVEMRKGAISDGERGAMDAKRVVLDLGPKIETAKP